MSEIYEFLIDARDGMREFWADHWLFKVIMLTVALLLAGLPIAFVVATMK